MLCTQNTNTHTHTHTHTHTQARFLLSKVNPSSTHNQMTGGGGGEIIQTAKISQKSSLQWFYVVNYIRQDDISFQTLHDIFLFISLKYDIVLTFGFFFCSSGRCLFPDFPGVSSAPHRAVVMRVANVLLMCGYLRRLTVQSWCVLLGFRVIVWGLVWLGFRLLVWGLVWGFVLRSLTRFLPPDFPRVPAGVENPF